MRDIATLCFKICAIFIGVFGLRYLPKVITSWPGSVMSDSPPEFHGHLVVLIAPLIVGAMLWMSARSLAIKLFTDTNSPFGSVSATDLQTIAFSVVGLIVLVSSMRDIVWTIVRYSDEGPNMPRSVAIGGVVSVTLTLSVGFWLLLGSRGIVNAIRRLRARESAETKFETDD